VQDPRITDSDFQRFHRDGAVLKTGPFDAAGMALRKQAVATDSGIASDTVGPKPEETRLPMTSRKRTGPRRPSA